MARPPKSSSPPDPTAALLALCRDILVCQEGLSACAVQIRSHLEDGLDADRVAPVLQGQAENAQRLKDLVQRLGESLRETRIPPQRRDEVRQAVDGLKVSLARLAESAEAAQKLISRRGVRIPGVGGRPHPRRPFRN